jgi:precorrin-3B C17-methyltransferase
MQQKNKFKPHKEPLKEQLTPEQLYEVVENIIRIYAEQGKKREPFLNFINRYGLENLKSQLPITNNSALI